MYFQRFFFIWTQTSHYFYSIIVVCNERFNRFFAIMPKLCVAWTRGIFLCISIDKQFALHFKIKTSETHIEYILKEWFLLEAIYVNYTIEQR